MLNFLQLVTVKSQIYNRTEQSGTLIYYLLFLFQPSFLLQLTASISFSTLLFFFFFPLPRCSIVFPSLKKSHHQFRFYHHWSNQIKFVFFFSPFGSLCPLFYRRRSGSFLSVLVVLPPKIPATHWSQRNFQSSWSLIPTTRNGAKTELDSNGPKTELDSNDLSCSFPIVGLVVVLVLFSDCDRRGRRRLGCGSLLSGLFFPFWFFIFCLDMVS